MPSRSIRRVGMPRRAQRREVSTQIRFGPIRRTAPALRNRAATGVGRGDRGAARIPKRSPAAVGRTIAVSRIVMPSTRSATPPRARPDGPLPRRIGSVRRRRAAGERSADSGAPVQPASTVPKTAVGGSSYWGWNGHRRPARSRPVVDVDAGARRPADDRRRRSECRRHRGRGPARSGPRLDPEPAAGRERRSSPPTGRSR